MLNTPRALKSFLILAPHPKSLRQIGKLGFFGTNSGSVYEPLLWEVRFVLEAERGDRSIGEANLRKGAALQWPARLAPVRGVSPFNGRHASCLAGAPCSCPVSKSIAPNRGNWGFPGRTPEVYTNLSRGRFVLCWERSGDRSIGEANLRKGAALQWKCASHPSMEVRLALFFMRGGIARF